MAFNKTEERAISKVAKHGDLALVFGIVGVLAGLMIPLPTPIIDFFLTLNISIAMVVLLVCMYIDEALDFSSFPSLLLFTTLLRLALNVSTTRLILLKGYAGSVVEVFGGFVVGGNYVVGIVIFLILVVIQFAVITKGSGRIAEVAARFTLDAMPGKQMSIDADLNSGLITEEEAKLRRVKIRREADFYGAMDGASKFVRGDATAGLIITFINILGGFAIGVYQLGIPLAEALQKFTILTIGDGLVAQIPSLIISTAAGIIVTRAGDAGESLGTSIFKQLLIKPKSLAFVSGVLFCFSLVPGLPRIPFFVVASLTGIGAYMIYLRVKQEEFREIAKKDAEPRPQIENVEDLLQIDPMELEIGYGLISLVDIDQGGDILERISSLRRQFAVDLGIVIPPIRIRDNMELEADRYRIKIKGITVAEGEVIPNSYLAMNPGNVEENLPNVMATTDPVFGLPAYWIDEKDKERAESLGYTVVDSATALITHITEVIKKHAYELLDRQEVRNLLDNIKKKYPAIIEELIPNLITVGSIQKILQSLLKEQVPIRNLVTILETIADQIKVVKDIDILTEYVRKSLAGVISRQYTNTDGKLRVITIDPVLEQYMANAIQYSEHGSSLVLDPVLIQRILEETAAKIETVLQKGYEPVILCSPLVRLQFKRLTERTLSNLVILSYSEIISTLEVESMEVISVSVQQSPQQASVR